jgi:hypothetical protein
LAEKKPMTPEEQATTQGLLQCISDEDSSAGHFLQGFGV